MKNYYLLSQTKTQHIMAKHFEYNYNSITGQCYDYCTFLNDGTMIGSNSCFKRCAKNNSNRDNYYLYNKDLIILSTISCPKIIRRSQITGKVIMRRS
jgi:hypothetical protein